MLNELINRAVNVTAISVDKVTLELEMKPRTLLPQKSLVNIVLRELQNPPSLADNEEGGS